MHSFFVAAPILTCPPSVPQGALTTNGSGQSSGDFSAVQSAKACSMTVRVQDNQMLGQLPIHMLAAWGMPAGQAKNGNLALLVDFGGVPTHGIVLSEASGLSLVAGGCPPGQGCGSPTPIGGTFSTMIHIGENVPGVNARGDVLFLSDVDGGSSTRALFFYERASQTIQKVAAIGDPTPIGGTYGSVGLGSINDAGEAVFLAWRNSYQDAMILRWKSGTVQKVAAIGDPAPNASTFVALIYFLFGSPAIPAMAPRIREDGHVFFVASTNWSSNKGMFEEYNGQFTQLAIANELAPGGGMFIDFGVPIPNEQNEVAFSARTAQPIGGPSWYRGRPGQWERVIGSGDPVAGKWVNGITSSSGPFCNPFDDAGNLLLPAPLWDPMTNTTSASMIFARRGFAPEILLSVGDSTPLGPITQLAGFVPMTPNSVGLIGMEISTANGLVDAHMQIDICIPPDATTYCTAKVNSAGCLPRIAAIGIPSASASAGFLVRADRALNSKPGLLLYSATGMAATPFAGGTLCVRAPIKRAVPVSSGGSPPTVVDCTGVFHLDMNAFASNQLGGNPAGFLSVPGTTIYCQWFGRDPGFASPLNAQLSDAVQYRVTP